MITASKYQNPALGSIRKDRRSCQTEPAHLLNRSFYPLLQVFSQNGSRNEWNPHGKLISFSPEISPDFLCTRNVPYGWHFQILSQRSNYMGYQHWSAPLNVGIDREVPSISSRSLSAVSGMVIPFSIYFASAGLAVSQTGRTPIPAPRGGRER